MNRLNDLFYSRDASMVATDLLGKILIRKIGDTVISGKIVETEAYYGSQDPASRAYKGYNNFAKLMWDRPGKVFIYMVHANWLLNIITGELGEPSAVLIRALEPISGIDKMLINRKMPFKQLTNGPGKLTQALGITKIFNDTDITKINNKISIIDNHEKLNVVSSHRIGVSKDVERKLRFYVYDNNFVSKK
ncbi:MAG: DNA-3-methyladenine glycosylase [SAR202 cluster bacterium]|nr:DNA-3-methyladenine glycosylase [SAR202 cluster bacterium]|tara:strand:+ start:259 stop:831 length:573 start_codon:yes stop_codon:yes gene_type:complete